MSEVIGLDGPLSGGKTKTAIELMKTDLAKGRKLISNIRLYDLPHVFIPSEDLADFIIQNHSDENYGEIEKVFSYGSLLIDEGRVLISSRKSSSNLNEMISQFLMMLGKLDCNCYITFQRFMMVDIQLRQIMDFILRCKRVDANGNDYREFRIPYITPEGKIIPEQLKGPKDKLYPIFINVKIYEVVSPEEIRYTGKQFTYNPLDDKQNYNTRELVIVDRDKYRR